MPEMSWQILVFAVLLVLVAIFSKLIGCGLGAKACGFTWRESVQVGLGMACRGEVALIVANRGASMGLMPESYFGPVIIMVVCCAVFTPIALKLAFKGKRGTPEAGPSTPLVERYSMADKLVGMSDEQAEQVLAAQKRKNKR